MTRTKEQQTAIDKFHEQVIGLILKRRQDMRYSVNPQKTFEDVTAEIDVIEKKRKEYEASI